MNIVYSFGFDFYEYEIKTSAIVNVIAQKIKGEVDEDDMIEYVYDNFDFLSEAYKDDIYEAFEEEAYDQYVWQKEGDPIGYN